MVDVDVGSKLDNRKPLSTPNRPSDSLVRPDICGSTSKYEFLPSEICEL